MIIDSHAHYNNNAYKKPFRYLPYDKDGYTLRDGELPQLIQEMESANIRYFIEPGVSLQSCEEVLELAAQYPGRIFPAIGIHPTRSIFEKWSDRHTLDAYANMPGVIAIGEIGLDYHYKREEQHRLKQHIWFIYQLNLAWKLKLPVILHVRDAHEDALRILRMHPARKLGGVIHCFYGTKEIAEQYLELGYHIFKPYRKNGYATEAAKAILSYSHEVLSARLCAWIEAKNKASCALAESLGMEVVKVISDQTATGWPGAYLLYAEKMQ